MRKEKLRKEMQFAQDPSATMWRSWDSKHHLSNSKLVLSATTFTHPPFLCPGLCNSPFSHNVTHFHASSLPPSEWKTFICSVSWENSLFKAQLQCPLPIKLPTSPASLIASTSFLWQHHNDTKPSIHPSDHASIYPPKNHTNTVEGCLSRSI